MPRDKPKTHNVTPPGAPKGSPRAFPKTHVSGPKFQMCVLFYPEASLLGGAQRRAGGHPYAGIRSIPAGCRGKLAEPSPQKTKHINHNAAQPGIPCCVRRMDHAPHGGFRKEWMPGLRWGLGARGYGRSLLSSWGSGAILPHLRHGEGLGNPGPGGDGTSRKDTSHVNF